MIATSGRWGRPVVAGRPADAAAMVPIRYRVVDRGEESSDTATLTLEPIDQPIAKPAPGQFTMLWAFGVGEAPISLSGIDGDHLIHTVRAVGPVSQALAGAEPGTTIGVRGPFGRGWHTDHPGERPAVVVAGGLGLAPVRPLVAQLVASGHPDVRVIVGARRPDELLFRPDLERWADEPGATVEVTVDAADRGWRGRVGLVTDLLTETAIGGPEAMAYVCGPELMMWFTARRLADLGLSPGSVQVSLERNMHCAIGWCGHCQLGASFVCVDGPVYDWTAAEPLLAVRGR